jgi:hypothetical protein
MKGIFDRRSGWLRKTDKRIVSSRHPFTRCSSAASSAVKENPMTTLSHPQVGWGFWFRWMLASLLGITLGLCAFFGLLWGAVPASATVARSVVGLSAIGILAGIMQWSVLKEQGYKTLWWIPATALSWGVGLPLGLALSETFNIIINFRSISGWLMLGAWTGIVFGIAQWLVLRQQVRQSHWLMVADVMGWTVALPLSVLAAGWAEDPIFTRVHLWN